jgi:ATP-binding cassette subfamily B protein
VLFFIRIGGITVGKIASFIGLAQSLYHPIGGILSFYDIIQRGMVSLERIIDFLAIFPDVNDSPNAVSLHNKTIRGEIRFDDVSFAYRDDETILSGINLRITPGEKIAIVGASGSGKSTLISLLLRFYDVSTGEITIDSMAIKNITQDSLRAKIGIVFQDTFLFYGTIRDNLLFANPNRNEEELITACKTANIYDTIVNLPDGFDTRVGERGVQLSGGQRQRIAIARVILKDPAIIILDEATSAVDTVTEMAIKESIDKMLCGKTSLIIAHRLSTIKDCDRIIVIDDKTICEAGTHNELIRQGGMYATLYEKNLA